MTRQEIEKLRVINLNHGQIISITSLECGEHSFIIKRGRVNEWIITIRKNACSVAIERFDYIPDADYSKYGANYTMVLIKLPADGVFSIDRDFIRDMESIAFLQKLKREYEYIDKYL